jgi:alkylhydroperoxidase/carboxymuconolactone decarboxylase family protein YurZ
MSERTDKAEALIAKMQKDRGYIYPEWEFAARADPDFVEAYNNLYRAALNDGQALDAKTRELVALGILAYRRDTNAVKAHILRAMRLGATQQEILEAIETAMIPGGAPTFFVGLNALMQALQELKVNG